MHTMQRASRVSDSVVAAELDNEMVLLNVETGVYFGLDEVGTTIWSLITDGLDEQEIVERIVADYDVEPARVSDDVRGFIEQLEHKGLLLPGSA